MSHAEILNQVITYYCKSSDCNGIPLQQLYESNNALFPDKAAFIDTVSELIAQRKVDLIYDSNPHIKRFPVLPVEDQINLIQSKFEEVCLYPSPSEIKKSKCSEKYNDQPYLCRMWQGEPQLTSVYFDLPILENYSNDPRYIFKWHDFQGSISLMDEYHCSPDVPERDRTYIQSLGLGYRSSDGRRVAVVYLRYLAKLTPDHQQRWKSYEISQHCIIDPDYYKASIAGAYPTSISIYDAIIEELKLINKLCDAAKLPPFFNKDFQDERPKYFRIPFLNTQEAFHRSVDALNKMIVENINKKFFDKTLSPDETYRIENHNKSGKETVVEHGTLNLLKYWISEYLTCDSDIKEKISNHLTYLNEVRKIRQIPAHKMEPDSYGNYFADQHDALIIKIYQLLNILRLLFSRYPTITINVEIPKLLTEDKIRLFTYTQDTITNQ